VTHPDPVNLALHALGGLPADDHVQSCPQCRDELARLMRVVEVARQAGPEQLDQPTAHVWDGIAAAVGDSAVPAAAANGHGVLPPGALGQAVPAPDQAGPAHAGSTPSQAGSVPSQAGSVPSQAGSVPSQAGSVPSQAGSAPGQAGSAPGQAGSAPGQAGSVPGRAVSVPGRAVSARGRRRPRRRVVAGLAGLAAGLIIGVGGTAGVIQLTGSPAPRVIAEIRLNPLPQFPQWQGAAGIAVMRATAGQPVIAVTLQAPARPGFYEVWLLARNGVSMISLGDLNAGHTGTFSVPPGTDLRNYSRIDVSLQPFDGSTVHAKDSVVRGSLPPAA
jgi:Anti-sigma-K factor rskA